MRVIVNGRRYSTAPMTEEDMRPGAFIRWKESRRAFRIVCIDGDDVILRNIRKPNLLEAVASGSLVEECWLLLSEPESS